MNKGTTNRPGDILQPQEIDQGGFIGKCGICGEPIEFFIGELVICETCCGNLREIMTLHLSNK